MDMKEILSWTAFFAVILGWVLFNLISWRKEEIRAGEQKIILNAFIKKQNSNEALLANALGVLASQSTIVVFHDDSGKVIVRSVQTIDPEIVKNLVEREVAREESAIAAAAE